MIALVMAGLALVGLAWTVVVFRWAAARSGRATSTSQSVPEPEPETTFVGGVRFRNMNATAGLARLDCFDWGIRLRSSTRFLRWMIPTWEARYEELAKAQLITAPVASDGVRFQPVDSGNQVIFWTFRGTQVLDQLEAHGVLVDREVTRLRWTAGFDQQL